MKLTTIRRAAVAVGRAGALFAALVASPATIRAAAVLGGGALVSAGAGQIYPPAGYIVGGLMLLIAGLAGHMRGAAGE